MKRLLLIGGGHAHLFVLEALRRLAPAARAGLAVTLVSRELQTPYSGMLPGLIAGHYATAETHIDLRPLAAAAGVELAQARIAGLDPVTNRARADDGRSWGFDMASIDIGSLPPAPPLPGAAAQGLSLRPIDAFLQRWREIEAGAAPGSRIAVVGAGAGGVELALAIAFRLRMPGRRAEPSVMLISRGGLLPGYPARAARLAARQLERAGIRVLLNVELAALEPGRLHFADGRRCAADTLIWATGAAAQPWLAQTGLDCRDGFVQVNACLQSSSHPQVFAAGDAASHQGAAWQKSGVVAVRQGPVLAENLLRSLRKEPLLAYHPQRSHLALISTGQRHAIACWRGLAWEGDWVWRWKDAIDRRFMQRFSLPVGTAEPAPDLTDV
jgi:selenide,water dikinase